MHSTTDDWLAKHVTLLSAQLRHGAAVRLQSKKGEQTFGSATSELDHDRREQRHKRVVFTLIPFAGHGGSLCYTCEGAAHLAPHGTAV